MSPGCKTAHSDFPLAAGWTEGTVTHTRSKIVYEPKQVGLTLLQFPPVLLTSSTPRSMWLQCGLSAAYSKPPAATPLCACYGAGLLVGLVQIWLWRNIARLCLFPGKLGSRESPWYTLACSGTVIIAAFYLESLEGRQKRRACFK